MSKPGAGKQPRTRKEVLRYGKKVGGKIEERSNYTCIVHPKTGKYVRVPRGSGDIARGTLCGIMNDLKAIFLVGIVCLVPICLVVWLASGLASMY